MDIRWENAVRQGEVKIILDLLGRGIDVNCRDRYGQTGLMLAAHAGNIEIVKTLIAHRADLNVTAKFGLSAMMLAVVAGHEEVARMLAKAGADRSLRGTGAPGFVNKTAYDLAIERNMPALAADLKPGS